MSKSSKYILAAGCSFTDKNFWSPIMGEDFDCSWLKWPEILGEYLDLDVKNIGLCGVGNGYITSQVIQNILRDRDNIELVVIGWTEIQRFDLYDTYRFNPMTALHHPEKNDFVGPQQKSAIPLYKYLFGDNLVDKDFGINDDNNLYVQQVRYWFNQMFQIQELCKTFNIKFIMSGLCGSVNLAKFKQIQPSFKNEMTWTETQWHIMYGKIEELYELDKDHYIGYPFMKGFMGWQFHDVLKREYQISDLDSHPNADGQELIARYYYEQYAKVYS